jgi:asparagine synthase (glutamine-hydrolysing)
MEGVIMCGVFFILSHKPINTVLAQKSLELLSHRGPDNVNYKNLMMTASRPFNVYMGHVRLAIVDQTSASNQPMHVKIGSKNYYVVFNGEIYNYKLIKNGLINRYDFKTDGDTEVILASYILDGEKSFEKFDGAWSIIIFDEEQQKVVLSRDRFGEKPLYISNQNDTEIIISSQLAPILNYSQLTDINEFELDATTVCGYHGDLQQTCFTSIQAVQSATNTVICHDRTMRNHARFSLATESYWRLGGFGTNFSNMVQDELSETVRNLVQECVLSRVPAEGNIAVSLSGGLDSNIIAQTLFERDIDFQPITHIFNDPALKSVDEKTEASLTSQILGKEQMYAEFDYSDTKNCLYVFEEKIRNYEYPISDIGFSGYAVYQKLRNENFKVVLEGQGADEIFGGYEAYHSPFTAISNGIMKNAVLYLRGLITMTDLTLKYANFQSLYTNFVSKAYKNKFRALGIDFTKNFQDYLVHREFQSLPSFRNRDTIVEFISGQILRNMTYLLYTGDRDSMLSSIESRLPFTNHKLAELSVQQPLEFFYHNGVLKRGLRKAFEPVIRKSVVYPNAKKIGYPDAFDYYMKVTDNLSKPVRNKLEKIYTNEQLDVIVNFDLTRQALARQFFINNFS